MTSSSSSHCSSAILTLTLTLTFIVLFTTGTEASFTCTTTPRGATCRAMVDYLPANATTYSEIQSLFGVKKLYDLLGANDVPISPSSAADRNISVAPRQRVRVPLTCACFNGTGRSAGGPIYAVKPNNTLDTIAREIFGGLVTFQEIAAASGIPNPDLIDPGQNVTIPIPCSCDAVDGEPVVHYGHVVASGSSVEAIAATYGTTEETILRLNGMANSSDLMAAQLLDVPLKACSSSVRNTSSDSSLLVPNGTYVVTAQQCVKCRCDAANNLTLQCVPSQLKPIQWNSCPSTQCDNNVPLGNVTTTAGGCETCTYAGFDNSTIFTSLIQQPTCPGKNGVSKMGIQAWNWNFLLTSFILALFSFALY